MAKMIDMTGEVVGRLTVIKRAENSKSGKVRWLCICECGNSKIVHSHALRSGHTKSCGCLKKESIIKRSTTHGLTVNGKPTEYSIWQGMKNRCHNPNSERYKDYGARGIKVSDEWRNNFAQFYNDMGERPSPDYTVERIDNNKGYSKDNCRWATYTEQARNRRIQSNNSTGFSGIQWNNEIAKYTADIGINNNRIYLGAYSDLEEAIQARKEAENKYWYNKN